MRGTEASVFLPGWPYDARLAASIETPAVQGRRGRQGGCGGCFFAVLCVSSVDVMQNCEGSLSRDKFLF
jgi:hypothetical protein